MTGEIVDGHYLLGEELGRGGMGTVVRAIDLRTGEPVAIKFLHPTLAGDERVVERLRREARLAASITSPHVVRVLDLIEHAGAPAIVMEYVPGPTLAELADARGRLPAHEALTILRQIALALAAAHVHGIVHRDLKLDNVKLTGDTVKVLDYGLARIEGDMSVSTASLFLGTPEYTAPERMEGLGDIRGDIYAAGVILYRLLEGRLPFTGRTPMMVMMAHINAPVPGLSEDVAPAVAALARRCLAKRPEDRYGTPDELVAALDRLLALPVAPAVPARAAVSVPVPDAPSSQEPIPPIFTTPPAEAPLPPARPARDRRRFLLYNAIALAAVVAVGLALFIALR